MVLKGGPNIYGIPVGVLCLESYYYKVPGHIKNAGTFNFPVVYKIVKGATPKTVVEEKGGSLLLPFIKAAKELEQEGVKAITGSCGFLALFQNELAEAVSIPVFISSILQVPIAFQMTGRNKKVGILAASKKTLGIEHLKAVGAENVPVCIAGMDGKKEFYDVIIERKRTDLDITELQKEVMDVVDDLYNKNRDMGALVIECTDLPPFAYQIQKRINKPVFDIITLTNLVYQSVMQKDYLKMILNE